MKRKLIAAVMSVFIFGSGFTVSAEPPRKITAIGDSITAGYGLEGDELSYTEYLAEYYDAEVSNHAVVGDKTYELIELLDEDEELRRDIAESDLICVTIGGNDVLFVLEEVLGELIRDGIVNFIGSDVDIDGEKILDSIVEYASDFEAAADSAAANVDIIYDKLHSLNPDASIVFQTVYNPFETDIESRQGPMNILKVFASGYLGKINDAFRNHDKLTLADINLKFSGYGWLYTNIDNFDIHPNALGHMLIAEEIIQRLDEKGKPEVFKRAFGSFLSDNAAQMPDIHREEYNAFVSGIFRTDLTSKSVRDAVREMVIAAENKREENAAAKERILKVSLGVLTAGTVIFTTIMTVKKRKK